MKIINKKSEKSLIDQFIRDFKKDYLRKKKQNKRLSFVLTGGKSPIKLILIGVILIFFGETKGMFLTGLKILISN